MTLHRHLFYFSFLQHINLFADIVTLESHYYTDFELLRG